MFILFLNILFALLVYLDHSRCICSNLHLSKIINFDIWKGTFLSLNLWQTESISFLISGDYYISLLFQTERKCIDRQHGSVESDLQIVRFERLDDTAGGFPEFGRGEYRKGRRFEANAKRVEAEQRRVENIPEARFERVEDDHFGRSRLAWHLRQLLDRCSRFRLRLHRLFKKSSRWLWCDTRVRWQRRHIRFHRHWTLQSR